MAVPGTLRIALISMHTTPFADPGAGDVGGMNVVVKQTARALAALGQEVEIFTRRTSPEAPATVEPMAGVRVHHLSAGPARVSTKAEQEHHVTEFKAALQRSLGLAKANGTGWNIIHSQHWFSGAAALDLARDQGLAHIQSFHSIAATHGDDWSLGEQPESPGRVPAEARLARESDAIIAVSTAEADTVVSLGAAPQRVHVVPPGVDHEDFHPPHVHSTEPSESSCREDPFHLQSRDFILAAARLEPLKGLDLAIEMLAQIPRAQRPRLIISGAPTGGYEGYDHELHRQVEELGLREDVWFAGPLGRADLAEAMRRSAAVIIPSHSETYGLVALEAAACGVPVIAARAGGLTDSVVDGVTGILVDGRNARTWAQVVERVVHNQELRLQMGHNGWVHAANRTWTRTAQGWMKIYNKMLERKV